MSFCYCVPAFIVLYFQRVKRVVTNLLNRIRQINCESMVLISIACWLDIFCYRPHLFLFMTSFGMSSLLFYRLSSWLRYPSYLLPHSLCFPRASLLMALLNSLYYENLRSAL